LTIIALKEFGGSRDYNDDEKFVMLQQTAAIRGLIFCSSKVCTIWEK
jgi:hypothetical protein